MVGVRQKINTVVINIAVLLGVLFVLEAAAYGVVRYLLPIEHDLEFFACYDSDLGWVNRAGASGIFDRGGMLESHVSINDYGLRGPSVEKDKPSGIFRVAILGDSFAWGLGVHDRQTLSAQLSRLLPPEVEVLNFAVSGYGRGQQWLQLRREVLSFNPDAVIVLAYPGNDLYDNVADDPIREAYPRPRFSLDNHGQVKIMGQPVPEPKCSISERRLAMRASRFMGIYLRSYLFRAVFHLVSEEPKAVLRVPPYYFEVFQCRHQMKLLRQATVEAEILCKMRRLLDERGISFLVAVATTMEQMQPMLQARLQQLYPEMDLDWRQPNRMLFKAAEEAQVSALDLYPSLVLQDHPAKPVHHHIDTHWTPHGQLACARALQPWIVQEFKRWQQARARTALAIQ